MLDVPKIQSKPVDILIHKENAFVLAFCHCPEQDRNRLVAEDDERVEK